MNIENIKIRVIEENDNVELAKVIRAALTEFGANKPGTVYYEASTDALFDLFQKEKSIYFVAVFDSLVVGGGGIFPTSGLPDNTCELVKMYLAPQVRGIGLGKLLIQNCIAAASNMGFEQVYLETMPELCQALKVYEKFGFEYLTKPMGKSGHFGCDLWMCKKINLQKS